MRSGTQRRLLKRIETRLDASNNNYASMGDLLQAKQSNSTFDLNESIPPLLPET